MLAGGYDSLTEPLAAVSVTPMEQDEVQTPCDALPDLPEPRYGHVGVFAQGYPIVCGGLVMDTCVSYDSDSQAWIDRGSIDQERYLAAAVMLSDTEWWITGGQDARGLATDTTIIYDITTDEWRSSVYLPQFMSGHALIKVNSTTYFLYSNTKAWIFDQGSGTFQEQYPPNNIEGHAYFAGLATKASGSKDIVIVEESSSTELFNLDSLKWRKGHSLYELSGPGASIQYGDTFLAAGGMADISENDDVPRTVFIYDPEDEEWVTTGKSLPQAQVGYFPGMVIPEDFVRCN